MITVSLGTHTKGDTFPATTVTILDDLGGPVDLTGATLRIEFRYFSKSGSLTKAITEASGITIIDAVNGVISIDAFLLTDWKPGYHYYDIETTISGVVKTYVEGTIQVLQDVTQPAV